MTTAKKKPIIWGWDDGYGDGKGVTREEPEEKFDPAKYTTYEWFAKTGELLIPYYVAPYRKPKRREPGEKLDLFSHITVVMEDGAKWIIGQGAIDQDSNGVWDGQEDKHSSVKFPVFMTAFLGIMAEGQEVSVDGLGMGLPVEYEEDEARHDQLKKLITGTAWHKCTLILADQKTIWEPSVNVKNLVIKKQAEAAMYDQCLDDEGSTKDADFLKQFNVVGDIGARTFGVFAMRGLTPVDDLIFQTDDGMYVPYELIRHELVDLRGAPVNDIQVPSIIRSGKYLNIENEEVDIWPSIVSPQYKGHASKVTSIMKTRGKNFFGQVHRVIWTGGGSEQLKDYIVEYMSGIKAKVIFAGRFSNARGQRKIAARYLAYLEKQKVKVRAGEQKSEVG